MSTPPPPPAGDAPLPPGAGAPSASQMQPIHMGGASAKSGKGKLIGIIAGVLIVVGGLVFVGITLWGDPFATPDGTVKYVLNGIANNKPEVLWEAMPASYKQTLNAEFKKSMANTDLEVHGKMTEVGKKLTDILKDKKSLVVEAIGVAADKQGEQVPAELIDNYDHIVELLDVLANSKMADTTWVQDPDLGVFIKEDGGKLMSSVAFDALGDAIFAFFAKLSEAFAGLDQGNEGAPSPNNSPKNMAELRSAIKAIEVIVVDQNATAATLKLRSKALDPDDPESDGFKMVKFEDRWLPEEMAVDLEKELKNLKQVVPGGAVADTKMTEDQKEVTLKFLKSVDGVLDAIDKQETAENMMQAAMGGWAGLALQLVQLQNAFPGMGIAGGNPGGFPGGNPGSFPGGNPGSFPGGNPGSFPGGNPGSFPGGNPGSFPGGNPGGVGVGATLPFGKRQRWTINGGKPDKRIDLIYMNKPATTIETVFGMPDSKEGSYWIYKGMTVRNIGGGGTMKTVYFGIQNGLVFDIQPRP